MTMPTFEPVAWSAISACGRRIASPTKIYPWLEPNYTADQLQQAYEAGKRDAAPQVEQEPAAFAIPINMEYLGTPGNRCTVIRAIPDEAYTQPLYAAPPAPAVPDVLFDGYAVFQQVEKSRLGRNGRTSPENVTDVLDAVVKLIRAASPEPTK